MNNQEFINQLKNSNLANKEKLEKIFNNYKNPYNIPIILEIFDLQQCNKKECYWYHNFNDIYKNNCCLSTDCFYDCYKSGFEEYFQEKDMFANELGETMTINKRRATFGLHPVPK